MLGLNLGLGVYRGQQSLTARAMSAIKRNGGSLFYIPDDLGMVLGVDLISNGDFASSSGWSTGASWSIGSGVATKGAGGGSLSRSASLSAGKSYAFTFTVTSVSNAGSGVGVSLGNGASYGAFTTVGTFTQTVVAGASTDVKVFARGDESWQGSIDNIIVKEIAVASIYTDSAGTTPATTVGDVLGLMLDKAGSATASQPTTNFKPLLQVNAQGKYAISFDGSDDFLQTGITTGNAGWVCAGVTQSSAANVAVSGNGASGVSAGVALLVRSTGALWGNKSNGASEVTTTVASAGSVVPGVPFVYAFGWDSTINIGSFNGVEVTQAAAISAVSATPLRIGEKGNGSEFFNGQMTAQVICPVLPSAADRTLIRKWIGSLQGQSL